MSITTVLMKALGGPLAKFLIKNYLSEPAEGVGEALLELAQTRIADYGDQRKAQRQFEDLGERIAIRLVPLFEQEVKNNDLSVEAVSAELAQTLNGRISADFFLARDLDPARLTAALRHARPLPESQFSAAEVALYDRALDEVVRYVVQVTAQLPRFDSAYAAVSLQRLTRISADLEEVLDTTRRIEQTVTRLAARSNNSNEQFGRYEADYRQAVMRNLDYLELFGADITPESRRHALSVAYISLNLKKATGHRKQTESLPAESVLDSLHTEAGRLLIRGEAGSGKSTLSRWTAIQAASFDFITQPILPGGKSTKGLGLGIEGLAEGDEPGARASLSLATDEDHLTPEKRTQGPRDSHWRMRVPFLLRLRDCKDGRLPTPDEFPAQIAKEIGNPPSNWVASVLQSGEALVILDGIDEVPNVHREQLRRAIISIVAAFPKNYFLASTRPTAIEEGWLGVAGFREAVVDPMSDVDRTLFITRWHEAVARELSRLGKPDPALPEIASELIEHLPEHPPVARLATNPLLCAMICALHRERSQKLPESQAELCEAICQMLLHRRERESGLSIESFPEAYRALTYPEKRAIVQDVAHYMVRNGESTIAWGRAQQSVQDSLRQFSDRKGIDAHELLRLLIERSGVLRETRPGEIDFIHNTLKEYLAAERFADADDAGQLADKYADASWQPVILFSAATNRREFATRLVHRVLNPHDDRGQIGAEELRARRLFALRCRAAALHLSPELIAELDSIEASLFPPRSMADAEAFASGGDAAVEYLQSRKRVSEREAAACVRTLRLIGTRKANKALRSYVNDGRKTVVSELAQAINPLEIAKIRKILQRGEDIPEAYRAQIADLSPVSDLNLSSLNLSYARINDLAPLAGLTKLRILNLARTYVSDLMPLSGLTQLEVLDLGKTQVQEIGPLERLTSLRTLSLWGTQVSDIAPLKDMIALEMLNLWSTAVSDLTPLSRLTRLQSLDLARTQVTDIAPLAGLAELQFLDLGQTRIRDISPLAGMSKLQSLDLGRTQVTDLSPLSHLNLEYLLVPSDLDTSALERKSNLTIHRSIE